MTEYGEIAVAILGSGGVAGLAKWGWAKLEKRFTDIEADLEECKARELQSANRRAAWLASIELLWQEVERLAPTSRALVRAKKLMDEIKAETPN